MSLHWLLSTVQGLPQSLQIGSVDGAIRAMHAHLFWLPRSWRTVRARTLTFLTFLLYIRYLLLTRIDDLDEAIIQAQDALPLYPPERPEHSIVLRMLIHILYIRYQKLGKIDDLNETIALSRNLLSLCSLEDPYRPVTLNQHAGYLSTRYQHLTEIDDLNEAIITSRDVISLLPPGHSDRSASLNALSGHLMSRYRLLGVVNDLNDAMVLARDALSLRLPGHSQRSASLSILAGCLFLQHDRFGAFDNLNEAITLSREALLLRPPGHSDRSTSFTDLSVFLARRYDQLGGIDDLNEAITLSQEALLLLSRGHPDYSTSLNNTARYLVFRYQRLGGVDDLSEAIVLSRDTLSLSPPGHSDRLVFLHNLAADLYSRFDQLGGIDDLNEAIVLSRDALSLCPPGHPHRPVVLNSLAGFLASRYEQPGGIDDLNEAIALARDALSLLPPGHLSRPIALQGLAFFHFNRFKKLAHTKDRDEAFSIYAELAQTSSRVFSSTDLLAARTWIHEAEVHHHSTTLLAYETAFRFLAEYLATLPSLPQHLDVLRSLSSLAVDAFSAYLRNQSPMKAVEFLEQGRGLFWSQLTRLRSPLDDVVASSPVGKGLADEFARLTSAIRIALDSPDMDRHDRVCHLNIKLQNVVSKIRELPGLSRFLLPTLFSDLQHAASGGPVIIVNASEYSCDALIVFSDKDPVHIPLPVTRKDVRGLSSRLRGLTKLAKREDTSKEFHIFLRELWERIVSHIVDFLQTTCPLQSRIWWCPTAEFSLLLLHAASPFRKGQRGVSDLYTSSYATTLTALIRARKLGAADTQTNEKRLIAIGQAAPKGAGELLSVDTELTNISQLLDGLATLTRIEGEDACISNVARELHKHEWVRLACHGVPNREQPFESAFALRDGPFTIQQIIQSSLENPEFAYLSACHTTVGYEENSDEMIHLASAMQFVGFRSVIGTMWAVDDAHTNKVTSEFYKHMVDESGRLNYTRAARALRKMLKSPGDIPVDQRILYIHLGA